jgi:glycosyltransferase involved in cell wall biosynthesis
MSKLRCSAPLLTLNNYADLKRLLPTLLEQFEDVYILDGNSTDGTRELAQSLGVRVENQFDTNEPNQRIQDFRAMRLRLWSLAKYDWVFTLDADEEPTPECLQVVRGIIERNTPQEAHSFCRVMRLPTGPLVQEAFSYPDRYIRVFRRSDGLSLVERKVHERFIVPPAIRVVPHNEGISSIWLPPDLYFQKVRRYLAIEAQTQFPSSVFFLLRWILYYNIRSFTGQSLRAVCAYGRAFIKRRVAMPLPYTLILLWYRLAVMIVQSKAWWQNRRREQVSII